MSTIKQKPDVNSYSQSLSRGYSTYVSNVPGGVSDLDALTGAWRKKMTPPRSSQELDMERVWELRHGLAGKMWLINNAEHNLVYAQKRLKDLKQQLLYDVEHLDKEIVDYSIEMAVNARDIRDAPMLFERWVKEATAEREDQQQQDQKK